MGCEQSIILREGRAKDGAFTLTELLIVVAIIVLMIGLAVPIMGVLTGNRSVDGAQNIIQSMLNESRMQAIAQQRDTGDKTESANAKCKLATALLSISFHFSSDIPSALSSIAAKQLSFLMIAFIFSFHREKLLPLNFSISNFTVMVLHQTISN